MSKLKISFQGVEGAYSHIACMKLYPNAEYIACDSFEIAMQMVKFCQADFAVIPVENSNAGRVSDVHFLLPKSGLFIVGEYFLRIRHQLLGLKNAKLNDITLATSHPQALAQSSIFLKEHNILPLIGIDTAKSCLSVIEENNPKKAAIASELAGEIYGLKVLAPNIENAHNNATRFLIMANKETPANNDKKNYITSFIFVSKNLPASLYNALGCFAKRGINMTKIESYVLEGKFVSVQFYVEIEANYNQEATSQAFAELKNYSDNIQILGCYEANAYRQE